MNIWQNLEALEEYKERRRKARKTGKRLAFDCLNLKCHGNRGFCALGKSLGLSKDGSINIKLILNGITPSICKECLSFSPDDILDED